MARIRLFLNFQKAVNHGEHGEISAVACFASVNSATAFFRGRNRSALQNVRLSEIVADEQQRFAKRLGQCIDRAVAKVQLGGMSLTLAVTLESLIGKTGLLFVEGRNDCANFFQKACNFPGMA